LLINNEYHAAVLDEDMLSCYCVRYMYVCMYVCTYVCVCVYVCINKEMLLKKHYKAFVKFTKQLDKIKEMNL